MHYLKNIPFYHWLLPVFFVLHGYTDYYPFIPLKDASVMLLFYMLAALILSGTGWLFFRDKYKAAIPVFLLLGFNFFFGPVHDALKMWIPGNLLTRYSFMLPAALIFFLAVFILLKKRKKTLFSITSYLNILMIIVLITELILLSGKLIKPGPSASTDVKDFKPCTDCSKPDTWLIIADGYAGKEELDSVLHYDNSGFENQLKQRGFHIIENSISNYNYTPFSVASLLDMNFIDDIKGSNSDMEDLKICFNIINNSSAPGFLKNNGYKFFNYSLFDFDGQPSVARPTFLPTKTKPLVSQTFTYRVQRDLWYHLVTGLKLYSQQKKSLYHDLENNNRIYDLTKETASKKITHPKFVYSHFVMPHYPYYFDSTGKERPFEKITEANMNDTSAYISYLKYVNKKLLELVDYIQKSSTTPPVILLVGDHGLREFNFKTDQKYYFSTLGAVLLPGKNYSGYDSVKSHVNQFRAILNSQFGQNLPLLKDSTRLITE